MRSDPHGAGGPMGAVGAPWGPMGADLRKFIIEFNGKTALGPRIYKSLFAGLLAGHDPGPSLPYTVTATPRAV